MLGVVHVGFCVVMIYYLAEYIIMAICHDIIAAYRHGLAWHVDTTTTRQQDVNDTTAAARPAYQLETC